MVTASQISTLNNLLFIAQLKLFCIILALKLVKIVTYLLFTEYPD